MVKSQPGVVMREHMICMCGLLAPVVGRCLDSQKLRVFENLAAGP